MTMDRDKEREIELESAMYTNCLLLGLDPSIIGVGGSNRVGLFRHSNPKLGEQLLYFLLSSLRGPVQSAKDFDKVWPIFDSAQSREFRKVVHVIISELESQGGLPRSNSRVSSLATCCGPRFVELLWQLSLHALQEVHRRIFAADAASNPLPASLTDVAFTHAATLLPVTKARIALERRRFLKNAETVVQREAMWSDFAHEKTVEFRGLFAEEACLQQELERLHHLRNKVKLEGELWEDLMSSSSQNSHLVSKATRLWDSILARKSQHEILASGPIEDLIAHREHRYRISGSSLLAAMDQSSQVPHSEETSMHIDDREHRDGANVNANIEKLSSNLESSSSHGNDEKPFRIDDRSGRVNATVDVAEIFRRWTHSLQRIHKQSLLLAKANDGEGPELLRSPHDGSSSGHAESLAATLAEHQRHLANFQVLINQLKEVAPTIQKSIADCTKKVDNISSGLPPMKHWKPSASPSQTQSSGRVSYSDDIAELNSKISSVHLDKGSAGPALKLPPLFSLTPNSSSKGGNMQKRHNVVTETLQALNASSDQIENQQDGDNFFVQNLKRSVREAALSSEPCSSDTSHDNRSDQGFGHFFLPLSTKGFSHMGMENKVASGSDTSSLENRLTDGSIGSKIDNSLDLLNDSESLNDSDQANGFRETPTAQRWFYDIEESQGQILSPPFLMDTSLLADSYEDLLAPLSETEAALMEH